MQKLVPTDNKNSPCYYYSTIQSGLDFILSHFSEPLFPRKISTAATQERQREVDSKERAMLFYQGALWLDCRINAFGLCQKNPNLIFIDIDSSDFSSMQDFVSALTTTLKNIEKRIGGHPSVIWSGRGFHILQPINCPTPLEDIKDLVALEPETSKKFLQFAARYLSNGKCDKNNHPALRSCLLRIPRSINLRCRSEGLPADVKVIQVWDGYRPYYKQLFAKFCDELAIEKRRRRMLRRVQEISAGDKTTTTEPWIEKLIQTPIGDYRKHARDLILIPYLVVSRGLKNPDEVYNIVMEWADKCDKLSRLQPSRREFEKKVYSRIREAMRDRVPHMSLDTLKLNNQKLHDQLLL